MSKLECYVLFGPNQFFWSDWGQIKTKIKVGTKKYIYLFE